jgi:hypothetical protein
MIRSMQTHNIMNLAFFLMSELYVSHEKLIVVVNTWAEAHDYALNIKRSNINKRRIKNKIWLKCDRDDKCTSSVEQKRLDVDSRLIECFFKAIAKWSLDEINWLLRIEDSAHNHDSILFESYSALWKLTLINQIKDDIANQSRARITLRQILTALRLDNDSNNSMFKAADIYNVKTALRRDALESFTSIQALIQNLYRDVWHCEYLKNQLNRVTHLFFIKKISKKLLKTNLKILIMNFTYKINRYKLSLLIIFEVIALNISFYIVFDFILHEIVNDFIWVLKLLEACLERVR